MTLDELQGGAARPDAGGRRRAPGDRGGAARARACACATSTCGSSSGCRSRRAARSSPASASRSSRAPRSRPTSPPEPSTSARVEGLEPSRDDLARAVGRAGRDARRAGVRRVRAVAARVIVRWGLDALPDVLARARHRRAAARGGPALGRARAAVRAASRAGPRCRRTASTRRPRWRAPATASSRSAAAARSISARRSPRRELPLVSIPTTYAGAEWTTYYGIRDPERKMRGGGAGARPEGIVYDVELTLDLPREPTVGTAMNALAHCAEALYVHGHNDDADEHALAGARLIVQVASARGRAPARPRRAHRAPAGRVPRRRGARRLDARARPRDGAGGRRPLRACRTGRSTGSACRAALRYNARHAPEALRRFGEAVGGDPAARVDRARRARRPDAAARARRPRGRPARAREPPRRSAQATRRTRIPRRLPRSSSCSAPSGSAPPAPSCDAGGTCSFLARDQNEDEDEEPQPDHARDECRRDRDRLQQPPVTWLHCLSFRYCPPVSCGTCTTSSRRSGRARTRP